MKQNISIIGAGVSGLVAALYLENLGYQPTIYEASSTVGGRVKSDVLDGYILDHGFQVLLSAYPLAQKYLDYQELQLQAFESGSYVFTNGKLQCIGDPLRNFSLLAPTVLSSVGSVADKLKIFQLTTKLKKKSIAQIFASAEVTTREYLKEFGFSKRILDQFFTPFFGGIFLENDLRTSSRMFEFIFKMFSEGNAAIPKNGIQAIPDQLAAKLKQTQIHFSKKVKQVQGNEILFEDGSTTHTDFCIIATEASALISNMTSSPLHWKATQTLYFEVAEEIFEKYMIGLLAVIENSIINSICYPKTRTEKARHKLLSVSVIKAHSLTEYELLQKVKTELLRMFNIEPIKYLKTFHIPKALPDLKTLEYTLSPSELQITGSTFMAGDTMLNGSLNAAMHSGELAAQAVHEKITGSVLA